MIFVFLTLVIVAFLPALVWLIFFLREDIHPEPRALIARTFLIGAFATVPALFFQIGFKEYIGAEYTITILLVLAFIEEVWKFLAAYYAINKSPFFDEPVDFMIYMVVAAAGFATVENVMIALASINAVDTPILLDAVNILLLRFVGATLLHILASAIIGYYWARSRDSSSNFGIVIKGIVIASFIHFLFNYAVSTFQDAYLIYASIIPIASSFFVLHDFDLIKNFKFKKRTPSLGENCE